MPTSWEWQYMGDRVAVTLCVPTQCANEAICLISEGDPEDSFADNDFAYLTYFDVNYGELNNLSKLIEHGIPFESTWKAGCEFGKGTNYCRFTSDGEYAGFTMYEGEENPPIQELLSLLDNYAVLKQYVQIYKESHTPLPWDNQIEYGKLYRLKQIITT